MKQVAVAIISKETPNGNQYLLMSSKTDFGKFTGFYYPPGGHIENGEDIENGLVRELKEELNLDIKPIRQIAVTPGDIKDQTTYWWKCEIIGSDQNMTTQEEEVQDVRWFSEKEIKNASNLWPATKKFFQKFIF